MYHYVYRITNTTIKKHYYGKRSSKLSPTQDIGIRYFSSSTDKAFMQDQKDNPRNYKYKVVSVHTTAVLAMEKEIKLHAKFDVRKATNFYNLSNQTAVGFDFTGQLRPLTEATKIKISNSNKGKKFTEDHKQKLREAKLGSVLSEAHKCKISEGNTGHVCAPETRAKIRAAHVGKPKSQQHKNAMRRVRESGEIAAKITKALMKPANIYKATTNELIATNVCLSEWCQQNGYSQGNLSATALVDEYIALGKSVRRQHKGVYAQYIQKETQ